MKGLSWDDFQRQAEAGICKHCECGATSPWRGNTTCLQAWLRFHSSRGIILSCNAARAGGRRARIEDGLMSEHLLSQGR
jgi:hypothetical protein